MNGIAPQNNLAHAAELMSELGSTAPSEITRETPAVAGLANLIEVLGIDDFVDLPPQERSFAPTIENALGLAFRIKEYAPSDPYITKHGIRRNVTLEAQQKFPQTPVAWKETLGILDLGAGMAGAIPLAAFDGAYIGTYFGFFVSAMLRYRRLELETGSASENQWACPLDAQKAAAMPAGSEIEFIGQGRLNLGGGPVVGGGIALGPFWVGFAGVAPVTSETIKEYSASVLAIDGRGKVRVVLRRLNSQQTTAGVLATAGFISPGYNGVGLVDDDLLLLVGNSSTVNATSSALDLTSASIEFKASHLAKSTVISAFDLDLNNPKAASVYSDLLRLCPRKAFDRAKSEDSGVELLAVDESYNGLSNSAAFNFFGEKIFLAEDNDVLRSGKMVRRDGSQLLYRKKIFEKRFVNFFDKKKSICWEGISMQDRSKHELDVFYHLKFEATDYEFVKSQLAQFQRLAKALKVPISDLKYSQGYNESVFEKLVSNAAKVDTQVDVYFTKDAVEHIEKCNAESASRAFLKAMIEIHPKCAEFPASTDGEVEPQAKKLLIEFLELRGANHGFGLANFREFAHLRRSYKSICGRNLSADASVYKEAQMFGDEIACIKDARTRGQIEHLFSSLGKLKGFHFSGAAVALMNIVGRKNVIINELSVSGRGARLGFNENGSPTGPHELMYRELTSA